jgi:Ca-activated chloride channel family protein
MTLQFADPWFLVLLALVPAAALLPRVAGKLTRPAGLRYAHNPLASSPSRSWRLTLRNVPRWLRFLLFVLVILALARPQTSEARETIRGEGVDIALALDMSGSMASLDFEPENRLEAAKAVIDEFIRERPYDRIGLVVFSSHAFVQSPPTIDHDVLRQLLAQVRLAPLMGIDDGTAIGMGLATAGNMLRQSDSDSKVIVLLTDGVNNSGNIDPETAAMALAALGIKVHTIGAGRPGRVSVPVRTANGTRIVRQWSNLDEATLAQIAQRTGGSYFRAENTEGLQKIYSQISAMEKSRIEVQPYTRRQEMAVWLLVPALAIFLMELVLSNTLFRRIP